MKKIDKPSQLMEQAYNNHITKRNKLESLMKPTHKLLVYQAWYPSQSLARNNIVPDPY